VYEIQPSDIEDGLVALIRRSPIDIYLMWPGTSWSTWAQSH